MRLMRLRARAPLYFAPNRSIASEIRPAPFTSERVNCKAVGAVIEYAGSIIYLAKFCNGHSRYTTDARINRIVSQRG